MDEAAIAQLQADIQQLKDINQIQALKHRYIQCIDSGDFAQLRSLLDDDVTTDFDGGYFRFQVTGADEFVSLLLEATHAGLVTVHQVHHPIIEFTAPSEATGSWYLWDDTIDLSERTRTYGTAIYRDLYVKKDGRWLIRHTGYTRVALMRDKVELPSELIVHVLGRTGQRHPDGHPQILGGRYGPLPEA